MSKIDKVFVFISESPNGDEGVVGQSVKVQLETGGEAKITLNMFAATKEAMESLIPQAQVVKDIIGKPIRIVAFSNPEEVAVLWPSGPAASSEGPERLG